MPLLMSTFQFLNPNFNGPIKLTLVDDDDDSSIFKVVISNEVIFAMVVEKCLTTICREKKKGYNLLYQRKLTTSICKGKLLQP